MYGQEIEYRDIHGMLRRTVTGPCSCNGDGCELCADPASYCNEYEPWFDGHN